MLLVGLFIGESTAQQTDSTAQQTDSTLGRDAGSSQVADSALIAQAQCATIRSWDGATQRGGDLAVGGQYGDLQTLFLNNGIGILTGVPGGSLSAATLAGVDAFFWGTSTHILTAAEATALNNFVQNGGSLILETDSAVTEQTSANSGYNALGLGNRAGAASGGNVGGFFENVVTATTVGPLGDLRTLSFDGSTARALDDTGHTLVGQNTVPLKTWVEYTVGSGEVLGLGDPYGFNIFSADNNDEAYVNYILGNQCLLVGGTLIGISTTALLLAGVQTNLAWIIPAIIIASGIGIFLVRRK